VTIIRGQLFTTDEDLSGNGVLGAVFRVTARNVLYSTEIFIAHRFTRQKLIFMSRHSLVFPYLTAYRSIR